MTLTENDSLTQLKGIGEKKAQAFARLGVFSLYDLVSFFPRRYEDRTRTVPIADTHDGETVCVCAVVADAPRLVRIRRGMELVKFRIADESGAADVTYFNQNWMKNSIHSGEEYVFYGRFEVLGRHRSLANPVCEKVGKTGDNTGKIVPVYKMTSGLNQKAIVQSVRAALDSCLPRLPEILPEGIRASRGLSGVAEAYENIHFPGSFEALHAARQRLIYEELFVLSCALGRSRSENRRHPGMRFTVDNAEEFFASLPFSPTGAQRRAVSEALGEMCSGSAMNRLLQGDVGSGKTLVAAALVWAAYNSGFNSAFMAPTEILASQHFSTLSSMLSRFGIKTALLTGSTPAAEKRRIKCELAAGNINLVIGTHALLNADLEYSRLALVITDEQHRFGVNQRAGLVEKGRRPHVLVMSATPIPRTLALILYSDLDVSVLDEMPAGRQKVDTFAVGESYRARLNEFIRKQAAEGHQSFVVCPMVEEDDENGLNLKSAEEHSQALQLALPELKIACVHGRMKPSQKDAVMTAFAAGEYDVLVSTTVIEVGVDVPNATLMIIENAERFGLSQLHQLRGRVGRGTAKSYCVLVSDSAGDEVKARLNIMCTTNDGFRISEEDLRLRGPGDFFGSRQHGLPEMHIAELGADVDVLVTAKSDAEALLAADPELVSAEHEALKERVSLLIRQSASGFN